MTGQDSPGDETERFGHPTAAGRRRAENPGSFALPVVDMVGFAHAVASS